MTNGARTRFRRSDALRRLAAALALGGCATLAGEAGDLDAVRPNAQAGPFRLITQAELATGVAPNVLSSPSARYREPSALALGESLVGDVALYAVAELGGQSGIFRFRAPDARTFGAEPPDAVLGATEDWEGGAIAEPEAARVGAEIWLFYSAAGGIGLARSADGLSFEKLPAPVLGAMTGTWEDGPPSSPGFVALAPGDYRLFYAVGSRIGEATSMDGITWQRRPEPALEPSLQQDAFDSVAVGDPEPELAKSAEGRSILRVYYTGRGGNGTSGIGLAARFRAADPLGRATSPVLAGSRNPSHPALLRGPGRALLFVSARAGSPSSQDFPAIALAVAPATVVLPR